jgi:GntR family transcriptional regulator/MocR family aminotransferase
MRIPLDRTCATPLYQQIIDWFQHNIRSGSLPPDTRLPASRALAAELGISRITVQNAYAALESDGYLQTRQGSGTFVAVLYDESSRQASQPAPEWPLWQLEAAQALSMPDEPPLPLPTPSDLVSFTGVGDPRQFPLADFRKLLAEVLRRDGTAALEYGSFEGGYTPLRETVIHVLASQGIQASPPEVLITSGSQQALGLVCQVLLKPGDVVVVEKPTYNMALDLFRTLGLKIVGVPLDEAGMQVERLEGLLQKHHPRLIYTIPNFQNPTGSCMSLARRRQLLLLADSYNIPILEDDFAGDLRFEGRALPAIKSLDAGGRVIYTGTFSKMLMPGLRVGYLLASGPIFQRLLLQKRVQDLSTSTLMQRALDLYVTVGRYQAHLRRSTRLYRERRDVLLSTLHAALPELTLYPPQGGLFLWLKLPEPLSALDLLPRAIQAGVEYAPGARFFPDPDEGRAYLRLNFASRTPAEIQLGVRRLEAVIHAAAR